MKHTKGIKGWFAVTLTTWFKTWWHCLVKTNPILTMRGESHQMCSYGNITHPTRNFCSCGHLNSGITAKKFFERF